MDTEIPFIKNIIFDLGGVLIDINTQKVLDAIHVAGVKDAELMVQRLAESKVYYRFETGNMSPEEFCDEIRMAGETHITDNVIIESWNFMLSDFPESRVRLLQQLSSNYNLFLLSNTNIIHHQYYASGFLAQYGFEIESLFRKAYYSYEVKMHKPEKSIFEIVLNDSNLIPGETLFIDDTRVNCEVSASCGILSYCKPAEVELVTLFKNGFLKEGIY